MSLIVPRHIAGNRGILRAAQETWSAYPVAGVTMQAAPSLAHVAYYDVPAATRAEGGRVLYGGGSFAGLANMPGVRVTRLSTTLRIARDLNFITGINRVTAAAAAYGGLKDYCIQTGAFGPSTDYITTLMRGMKWSSATFTYNKTDAELTVAAEFIGLTSYAVATEVAAPSYSAISDAAWGSPLTGLNITSFMIGPTYDWVHAMESFTVTINQNLQVKPARPDTGDSNTTSRIPGAILPGSTQTVSGSINFSQPPDEGATIGDITLIADNDGSSTEGTLPTILTHVISGVSVGEVRQNGIAMGQNNEMTWTLPFTARDQLLTLAAS